MKNIKIMNFSLSLIALFFFSPFLMAQDMQENNVDKGDIDKNAFAETIATIGYIADWNTTAEGVYDDPELYVTTYKIWDRDENQELSEQEWTRGVDYYIMDYDENEYGDFQKWDADRSGVVDVNELATAMKAAGFFKADQADTNVSAEGMEDATLVLWDEDNDALIEKIEYGSYSQRFDTDDN